MATRALVGYMSPDRTVDVIYVHHGGLRDCGDILKKYYTNRNKVFDLIMLGDASHIDKNLEPTGEHSFENQEPGVCVFYGRDRGESGCESAHYDSVDELIDVYEERSDIEYIYLFDAKSNKWITYDMNNNGQIIECKTRKAESQTRRSMKLSVAEYINERHDPKHFLSNDPTDYERYVNYAETLVLVCEHLTEAAERCLRRVEDNEEFYTDPKNERWYGFDEKMEQIAKVMRQIESIKNKIDNKM